MTTKKKRPKSKTVKWETEHGSQEVTSSRSKRNQRGGRARLKRPRG